MASADDLGAVQALLRGCELPEADLTVASMCDFLTARTDTGELIGCVGLERAGDAGLLRSLAVSPAARMKGLGTGLLQEMESHALATGVRRLFLLTTSASAFFASKGYTACARSEAPAGIRSSTQFTGICPQSATCMSRNLAVLQVSTVAP
ncbi:arsenic resistance N-acetyltransferase ArsN2 [Variovorax rhizosphaerae]|uniref:Arsenic resistance N-acetyltransferase ArsN2 n=1 Tax=Variovorax rhizosphaerae TaxID=1836200 RepID=A0ABU8WTP5_9BURK